MASPSFAKGLSQDTDPTHSHNIPAYFVNLLDVSGQDSTSNIELRFDEIAKEILHHLLLVLRNVNGTVTTFEVLELEFYFWMADVHEDPFTHGAPEQARSGNWYFHRAPQKSNDPGKSSAIVTTGYRGGTRKGLDITFGPSLDITSPYFSPPPLKETPIPSNRGGILLRTLRNTSTGRVISGPSLVVDEILKFSWVTSISDLVTKQWRGDISAFRKNAHSAPNTSVLRFEGKDETEIQAVRIYQSPRIGLGLSHPSVSPSFDNPRVVFLSKPYRYFIHPELLTSNGRPQTFLGILSSLKAASLLDKPERKKLIDDICDKSGMKTHTVAKYLEYYSSEHGCSNLKSFIGSASKDSPSNYLRLMGILWDERSRSVKNTVD
ncbi:hypothetical protein EV359DRAFT_50076 [Lentinula novae-zelandiae]|nr:hypothetical protein EV359DRAFT_50076 [Lentinula novae-zelandiae]